jgi:hypothetical protein
VRKIAPDGSKQWITHGRGYVNVDTGEFLPLPFPPALDSLPDAQATLANDASRLDDEQENRFYYEQRYARVEDKIILSQAKAKNPAWGCMSVMAMRKRAEKYRAQHDLPTIPARKKPTKD